MRTETFRIRAHMSSQWVPMGPPCGISRRPNSMYMLCPQCPQDIGRDSWDKQEAGKPLSKQNGSGQPETTASTGKQGQPPGSPHFSQRANYGIGALPASLLFPLAFLWCCLAVLWCVAAPGSECARCNRLAAFWRSCGGPVAVVWPPLLL